MCLFSCCRVLLFVPLVAPKLGDYHRKNSRMNPVWYSGGAVSWARLLLPAEDHMEKGLSHLLHASSLIECFFKWVFIQDDCLRDTASQGTKGGSYGPVAPIVHLTSGFQRKLALNASVRAFWHFQGWTCPESLWSPRLWLSSLEAEKGGGTIRYRVCYVIVWSVDKHWCCFWVYSLWERNISLNIWFELCFDYTDFS